MKRALSNASWLLLGYVGRIGSQLLGISIIARLLTRSDFGVVAIAMVVSNLAGLLRDLGTGPAAIRSRDTSAKFYGGIYTIQLAISITLAVIICLVAPILAHFYHTESLSRVLIILAMVFPITAMGSVHLITLEKAERYQVISFIEFGSYVLGLAAAVAFAKLGFGVESLAYQAVVNAVVQTFLLRWITGIVIKHAHPKHAKSAAGGSAALTSYQLCNYVIRNSDTGIAGRVATTDFIGSYSMATRISQIPAQAIGMLLSRVSIPMLSKTGQDKKTLAKEIARLVEIAVLLSAGCCLILVALRTLITGILFGPQWVDVVPSQLVYLLPAAALISVSTVLIGVIIALGATTRLTRIGILGASTHIIILVVCLSIRSQLLPLAIYLSSVASILIVSIELRLMLLKQGVLMPRIRVAIPVITIVIYPFIQRLLSNLHNRPGRSTVGEISEAAFFTIALLLLGALQYHRWKAQSLYNQMKSGKTL